jgi:hypothetical protein
MGFHVFFSFSSGLTKTLYAPKGAKAAIEEHVKWIEKTLNLEREQYLQNPVHWVSRNRFEGIPDDVLCAAVKTHNCWVRNRYQDFDEWSKNRPSKSREAITINDAKKFWHAFEMLDVPVDRWNMDYYRDRMDHLYEVMRGRENQGVDFGEKDLTPRQAAQVINLFSTYLDHWDLRLDVPKDNDYLASSYDGGYSWCDKCFCPIAEDDLSCKKRGCPIMPERD